MHDDHLEIKKSHIKVIKEAIKFYVKQNEVKFRSTRNFQTVTIEKVIHQIHFFYCNEQIFNGPAFIVFFTSNAMNSMRKSKFRIFVFLFSHIFGFLLLKRAHGCLTANLLLQNF